MLELFIAESKFKLVVIEAQFYNTEADKFAKNCVRSILLPIWRLG